MKRLILPLLLISLCCLNLNCLVNSYYCSARTLKPAESAITFGLDNIVSSDFGDVTLEFNPHLGYNIGLPLRLETGLHFVYLPHALLEWQLRWQVNPRRFKHFDFSIDAQLGTFGFEYFYAKYGCVISKQIKKVAPYIHYFHLSRIYHKESDSGDDIDEAIDEAIKDFYNKTDIIGTGIEWRAQRFLSVVPQIQGIFINNFDYAMLMVSIGVRFHIPRREKDEEDI